MYPKELLLSDKLRSAHSTSWQSIGEAGDFFTGAQRVDMVAFFNVYNATAFSAFRKKFKTRRLKPPNDPQVRLGKATRRRRPKD